MCFEGEPRLFYRALPVREMYSQLMLSVISDGGNVHHTAREGL